MNIGFGRKTLALVLPAGLVAALWTFAAFAQAPNQGRLLSQPAPPNAAAYQAACQDAAVAAEIARLQAEIGQFNLELAQENQKLQADQASNPAEAVNDRKAIVALQAYIALDQQRLSALQQKPRCPPVNNPPPPPPPLPPGPRPGGGLVPPNPPVPPPVVPPRAVQVQNVALPGTVCIGSGYYYTISVSAPDHSNTPTVQNVTIDAPGVASVAYDIPSQTVTGVGLAAGVATATVNGYVRDVSDEVWPFQVNVTVTVVQCPPRHEGPTIIGLPPGLIEPGVPGYYPGIDNRIGGGSWGFGGNRDSDSDRGFSGSGRGR
jgi:hypothetical protein